MKRAVVMFALLLAACGKRGDPRPPVPVIPQATSDLVVAQRADQIVLSWTYPSLTTTGRTLGGFRRIVVYRHSQELPPAATASPNLPREALVPEAVAQFATVPELTPVQFARLSERVYSIEGANLTDATVGSRLFFRDTPPLQSVAGRPVRITYAVVTEGQVERSPFSNLASLVPLPVAVPPAGVTATPGVDGVTVEWQAPTVSVSGGEPVIIGYNIYRGPLSETEPARPANNAPVQGTSWKDQPPYGEHEYHVTAVASTGPPHLESDPSEPARARFRDLVPPPAPEWITALVETTAVRVVWAAVDAPDLAGYVVKRAEGVGHTAIVEAGKFALTPLMTETHHRDVGPALGIAYRYEVTAWDKSGNESEPVSTGWVVVPKTP